MGGDRAALGRIGADIWLVWLPPDDDQEGDQYAIVGRGVDEDAVRDAAKAADVTVDRDTDTARMTVPADALPEGFAPVASGRLGVAHLHRPLPDVVTIAYRGDGRSELVLQVARRDDALADLLGWLAVGEPRQVRGRPGVVGPAAADTLVEHGAPPAVVRTWQEADLVAVVVSRGLDEAALAEFLRGLTVRPLAELARVKAKFGEVPVESLLTPPHRLAVSGTLPDGVWGVGVHESGGKISVETVGARADGPPLGGQSSIAVDPDTVRVLSVEIMTDGAFVMGVAPARSERVVISEAAYGDSVSATVGTVVGGVRYFGAWLDNPAVTSVEAAAYDASGKLLGRSSG